MDRIQRHRGKRALADWLDVTRSEKLLDDGRVAGTAWKRRRRLARRALHDWVVAAAETAAAAAPVAEAVGAHLRRALMWPTWGAWREVRRRAGGTMWGEV